MFKNDKIEKRLVKSVVLITAMASVAAVIALIALFVTSNRYTYALRNYGFSQGDIGKMMVTFADCRSATRVTISYTDSQLITSSAQTHDEKEEKCQQYFQEMKDTLSSAEEEEQYNKIAGQLETYWAKDSEIMQLGNTTDAEKSAQAQQMAAEELDPLYDTLYEEMSALMAININLGDKLDDSLNIMSMILFAVVLALVIVAIIVSVIVGKNMARQLAGGIIGLASRMKLFAEGDLSSDFPKVDSKDEVHYLSEVAQGMAGNLHVLIRDIGEVLASLADGDFTAETKVPERYIGEFEGLKTSMDNLVIKLKGTLLQIGEASDQVDAGSGQLAESASALAEGATDQAGAVQELTATIESVVISADESAKRVGAAYKDGLIYRDQAEHGSQEMENLAEAMEKITEASKEIENIIAEIEDIASQTNLLSLNASIEAARAGEAGKGFAVVADQIGKLATDSAQSAVRTRELIQNSIQEIEAGNLMAHSTKQALEEVVRGIEFLSNASKEASEASYTQVNTMQEVEKGIEQISSVVQSNSAAAQETSATSEELAAQATNLKELVGQFVLR